MVVNITDLPSMQTRWVASRKAAVVAAVRRGFLSRDEAMARYALSDEELSAWEAALEKHGAGGLRATALAGQ